MSCAKQFLAPAIAGDMVGCIGVSEVGAGSDVAGLKTTARKDGDDYVINGSKMWITNSPSADFICLLANTSDDKPHVNKSLIVVPMKTPGITVSPHLDKLGMRSSETAQVFFDNVRVPQRYRIGHEGAGFMMQMLQFQEERLFGAANMIKGLEYCVDSTIDYCKQRHTFGNPLIDNQVIHFRLAELQTEIECPARPGLPGHRAVRERPRRHQAGLHGQAQGRPPRPRSAPTPACSTGAAWASCGTTRYRVPTATCVWCRLAAAPTKSCWASSAS